MYAQLGCPNAESSSGQKKEMQRSVQHVCNKSGWKTPTRLRWRTEKCRHQLFYNPRHPGGSVMNAHTLQFLFQPVVSLITGLATVDQSRMRYTIFFHTGIRTERCVELGLKFTCG